MPRPSFLLLGIALTGLIACSAQKDSADQRGPTSTSAAATPSLPSASPPTPALPPPTPAVYPAVSTDAEPGETVLVLHRWDWLAVESTPALRAAAPIAEVRDGEEVIFAPARMVTPGATTSRVVHEHGLEVEVPNAAMVRLPAGETAKLDDLVLTSAHQPFNGVQLATILDGGKPTSPRASLTSNHLFSSKSWGRPTVLPAGSFVRLRGPFSPGTSIAVSKPDGTLRHRVVLRADGDLVLGYRWNKTLAIEHRSACTPMPLRPEVFRGMPIWAPYGDELQIAFAIQVAPPNYGKIQLRFPAKQSGLGDHLSSAAFSMFMPRTTGPGWAPKRY